jgi:hypothetical protein
VWGTEFPAVSRVDESGTTATRIGEGAAQTILIRRHDNDVNVVGHQAICPDCRTRALLRPREQVVVKHIVASFEEHLLPAIAALGHVIGIAGQHEARKTSMAQLCARFALRGDQLAPVWCFLVNCHRN